MADKLLGRKSNAAYDQLNAAHRGLDRHDPIFDSESDDDGVYYSSCRPASLYPSSDPSTLSPTKMSEDDPTPTTTTEDGTTPNSRLRVAKSTYSRVRDHDHSAAVGFKPHLPLEDFRTVLASTLLPEMFKMLDGGSATLSLKALHSPEYHDLFVARAVRASLDQSLETQKWLSELLTVLYDSKVISRGQFNRGFEKLLSQFEDIELDVPDGQNKLMAFFECAVEDLVIEPRFMLRLPERFLRALVGASTPNQVKTSEREKLAIKDHIEELRNYKKSSKETVTEFLASGSLEILQSFLAETGRPEFKHEVVRELLRSSMGLTDTHREVVSNALSDLYGEDQKCFAPDDVIVGFMRILGEVDDIKLDCPEAEMLLSKYVARGIADDILPPVFVSECARLMIGGKEGGAKVLSTVQEWIGTESTVRDVGRFRRVWTALKPEKAEAREFKRQVRQMIFDHFDDSDANKTVETIGEMSLTPDQAAELVRKILVFSMERSDRERKMAVDLLRILANKWELDAATLQMGFDQIHKALPDVSIDIPQAEIMLNNFTAAAIALNLLPATYKRPQ